MKGFFSRRLLVRNLYGETLLENFLITAVTTILTIRFYLSLTGYPQVGGEHLHIAHMLYGGILMLVALFILFGFLNRAAYNIASVIAGAGFGFFIDELGKFITRDYNYFFQPTVAFIYIILVLIYLAAEALPKLKDVSQDEYLVNALELMKEVILEDLDSTEKKQALAYLKASDPENPMVDELRNILTSRRSKPVTKDLYYKTKYFFRSLLDMIVQNKQFYFFVIFFIILQSVLSLLIAFLFIAALNRYIYLVLAVLVYFLSLYLMKNTKPVARFIYSISTSILLLAIYYLTNYKVTLPSISFMTWGLIVSTALAAFIAFSGLIEFSKSQLQGLKFFRLSILVSILMTQFFLFYRIQFYALIGLALNVLMLLSIEYAITKKESVNEAGEINVKRSM